MMSKNVFVAGHKGMVGSAIVRALEGIAEINILTAPKSALDLTRTDQVDAFFAAHEIHEVYLAAAKVGGIQANNTLPADFIHQNLMIEANIINSAHKHAVQDLLFLGSSCIYPKLAPQPMSEEHLLTGPLEPTNEPYAVAKIAGIKLCESYNRQYDRNYRSVMPTNLYGPGDNFHLENSHVIPALIKKFHDAKVKGSPNVVMWGSGTPKREFLHVDDMANACVHVMNLNAEAYDAVCPSMRSHLNVGCGEDISIYDLAVLIRDIVGFEGEIVLDPTKPDGAPRKLLNIDRIQSTGWQPEISLAHGLAATYEWFLNNFPTIRS